MQKPFSIYSTWGLHDELGDNVELSESLAEKALNTLKLWKEEYGLSVDYFHLDAFWFDPNLGYRHFKKPHWPNGFEPFRDKILSEKMIPGLWYSTTGYSLDVPEWSESKTPSLHYSLVDGPYADILEGDLVFAAEKWDVRLFKFDFANFYASTEAGTKKRSPEETYYLSVQRLIGILSRLRSKFPDVYIIAHCGYAKNDSHILPGWKFQPAVDTSLLEAFDAVFSGDPQPSLCPQSSLFRAIDIYQDRVVYKMTEAGFPLDRIEDHGVLVANTNTANYRGRSGFRRSHIAQLARGGRRDLFYGDPSLLNSNDLEGLKLARNLFFDAFKRRLTTRYLGEGSPEQSLCYGYLTGGASRGLLYAVNSTLEKRKAEFRIVSLFKANVLFNDGPAEPPFQVSADRLIVELYPEQMVLFGLGDYADAKYVLPALSDSNEKTPTEMKLIKTVIKSEGDSGEILSAELPSDINIPNGAKLMVLVQAFDCQPKDPFFFFAHVFAKQSPKDGAYKPSEAHNLLKIDLLNEKGDTVKASRRVPEVPIWSGVSWTAEIFSEIPRRGRIKIKQNFNPMRRIEATIYLMQ